ncbi:hypothetical protein GTQ40_03685 [Flavobacteriaceae bacterium R38]|nr:hypothetical protein [Flavobacteriaceae bacterium R38]
MKQVDYREDVKKLLEKAYEEKLISWNDGLLFNDFIAALWRTFLKKDYYKDDASRIQEALGEAKSMELLASEIDLSRK